MRLYGETQKRANTIIERANTRFAPTIRVLNDVAQAIRELSVRAEAWASGCVRDRSGYETLNQLRITNYGKGRAERQDQPFVCGE